MLIAVTRPLSSSIERCELTHLDRTKIDVIKAIAQHEQYERSLVALGCHLKRLPALPDCPDAVFVEDTSVVFDEVAVIARPGAESRRLETASVADAVKQHRRLLGIEAPGTLDGGDVLCFGRHVFVGRSTRTNPNGIDQLRDLLMPHGYEVTPVEIAGALHLKSAATVVGPGMILANPACVNPAVFGADCVIATDQSEPAAANALRIGEKVLSPSAFPKTQAMLENAGINVVTVDLSELAKAEGAVTCCSLVFESDGGG
jgi:dimethylargininase